MFLLFHFIVGALSLERSPDCDVPAIEGHLHLTRIHQKDAETRCKFVLDEETTFFAIERYSGRYLDDDAWMNFTFEGSPPINVSVGTNQIWFQGEHMSMPTLTKLETSMWLSARRAGDRLTCHFSPPKSSNFGHLFSVPHVSSDQVSVVASSSRGMEQVIQNVSSEMPRLESFVKRKTIHALEQRVHQIEKDLLKIHARDERQDKMNAGLKKSHVEQVLHARNVGKQKDLNKLEIQSLRGGIFKWVVVTLILIVIIICISWRTYQRQKKQARWSL